MADDVFDVMEEAFFGLFVGARVFVGFINFFQIADLRREKLLDFLNSVE